MNPSNGKLKHKNESLVCKPRLCCCNSASVSTAISMVDCLSYSPRGSWASHRPGLTLSDLLFVIQEKPHSLLLFQHCPSERHVTGYSFYPNSCVSCLCHTVSDPSLHHSYLPLHPTPSSSLSATRCRHAASKGRKVSSSLQSVRCARLWYLFPSHAYLELSVFKHDLVYTDSHLILSMKSNSVNSNFVFLYSHSIPKARAPLLRWACGTANL